MRSASRAVLKPGGEGQQDHGVGGEDSELRQDPGDGRAVTDQLGEGVVAPGLRGNVGDLPHRRGEDLQRHHASAERAEPQAQQQGYADRLLLVCGTASPRRPRLRPPPGQKG